MAKIISIIVTIVFLAFGVVLGILNPTSVPFDLFVVQMNLPLSVLLALTFIVGMLVGSLFVFSQVVKSRLQISKLRKQNNHLSNEILAMKKESFTPESLKKMTLALENHSL